MRKQLVVIGLFIALASPIVSTAQTLQPPAAPPTAQSLPGTVLDYFTSFNTNLDDTFGATRFSLWTGASSIQNADIPLVNDLGLSYDLWHGSVSNQVTIPYFGLESITRNGGVAGSLVNQQLGINAGLILHDVKVGLYVDGGYDFVAKGKQSKLYGEGGLRGWKALGHHFFTGMSMGVRLPDSAQVFSAYAGSTF